MRKALRQLGCIVATWFALLLPLQADASVVRAASHSDSSRALAQRVAGLLENLMLKARIEFSGEVRLTGKHNFHAEAFFGAPGHILLGESYADSLSDGELTFVLAHELAHLLADHQGRLTAFYARRDAAKSDPSALHHELEMDADRLGLRWARAAGFTANEAATALERAYRGATQSFATHPAVSARTSALIAGR